MSSVLIFTSPGSLVGSRDGGGSAEWKLADRVRVYLLGGGRYHRDENSVKRVVVAVVLTATNVYRRDGDDERGVVVVVGVSDIQLQMDDDDEEQENEGRIVRKRREQPKQQQSAKRHGDRGKTAHKGRSAEWKTRSNSGSRQAERDKEQQHHSSHQTRRRSRSVIFLNKNPSFEGCLAVCHLLF